MNFRYVTFGLVVLLELALVSAIGVLSLDGFTSILGTGFVPYVFAFGVTAAIVLSMWAATIQDNYVAWGIAVGLTFVSLFGTYHGAVDRISGQQAAAHEASDAAVQKEIKRLDDLIEADDRRMDEALQQLETARGNIDAGVRPNGNTATAFTLEKRIAKYQENIDKYQAKRDQEQEKLARVDPGLNGKFVAGALELLLLITGVIGKIISKAKDESSPASGSAADQRLTSGVPTADQQLVGVSRATQTYDNINTPEEMSDAEIISRTVASKGVQKNDADCVTASVLVKMFPDWNRNRFRDALSGAVDAGLLTKTNRGYKPGVGGTA